MVVASGQHKAPNLALIDLHAHCAGRQSKYTAKALAEGTLPDRSEDPESSSKSLAGHDHVDVVATAEACNGNNAGTPNYRTRHELVERS